MDRGLNFVSGVMAEIYMFMGIQHTKMGAYQSNGTVELFHYVLMQKVLKAEIDRWEWDEWFHFFGQLAERLPTPVRVLHL